MRQSVARYRIGAYVAAMMRSSSVVLLAIVTSACGSNSSGEGASVADAGNGDAGTAIDSGADAAASTDAGTKPGELTIVNCTTTIAADAPEFFKRYFRCVTITTTATSVVVSTNALPPHRTNYYGTNHPNYEPFDTSRGSQYRANPNLLSSKQYAFTIPKNPVLRNLTVTSAMIDGQVGSNTNEYPMGPAGVALDSVALFNPLAAPGDDIEDEKYTFDSFNAHPAPDGTYHYHTVTPGPLEVLELGGFTSNATPGSAAIELYGIMCDGTPVLGCKELDGSAPSGTLDAQGGHAHDLEDASDVVLLAGRYHVHVCPTSGGRKFTPEIQAHTTCTR
jgi:hypothetical protein